MIGDLRQNQLAVQVVIGIVVVKAIIWVIALASGTSGGVLAPLLMMGAGVGALMGPYMPGLDRVPVVDGEKTLRLFGVVSRHDLVKPSLQVFAEERELEQFRQVWIPRSTLFAPTRKRPDAPDEHADASR